MSKRIGYLKQDQKEKPVKGGYRWGVAWRVVNSQGEDWFQPWCDTRREAIDVAKELDIEIAGPWES